MESTIVLESVANRTDYSPKNSLNWRTEIDRQPRITDNFQHLNLSIKKKVRNEQRVMQMIHHMLINNMRIDEGMCIMIDELLEGDLQRFMQLYDQVDTMIYHQVHIGKYRIESLNF